MLGQLADPVRARIRPAPDVVDERCVGDLATARDGSEDAVGYGSCATAGLVANTAAPAGVVYYRLVDNFPQPLREHCLRRLAELSRTGDVEELRTDEP